MGASAQGSRAKSSPQPPLAQSGAVIRPSTAPHGRRGSGCAAAFSVAATCPVAGADVPLPPPPIPATSLRPPLKRMLSHWTPPLPQTSSEKQERPGSTRRTEQPPCTAPGEGAEWAAGASAAGSVSVASRAAAARDRRPRFVLRSDNAVTLASHPSHRNTSSRGVSGGLWCGAARSSGRWWRQRGAAAASLLSPPLSRLTPAPLFWFNVGRHCPHQPPPDVLGMIWCGGLQRCPILRLSVS